MTTWKAIKHTLLHPTDPLGDFKCLRTGLSSKWPLFIATDRQPSSLCKYTKDTKCPFPSEISTTQSILYYMCGWVWERKRQRGRGRKAGAEITARTLVTQGHSMAQHLIWRETEPSVWHRICFQEITTFLYFSTTVHGRRQKKDRESECKSFAFLPNLCLHALPQTSTQTCSGPETLITSACVLFWLFTACQW